MSGSRDTSDGQRKPGGGIYSKEVEEFHELMKHKLKEVEERGECNPETYAKEILEKIGSGEHAGKASFKKITEGKTKEEVSHYFFACMMLASNEKIEIEEKPNGDMMLSLKN